METIRESVDDLLAVIAWKKLNVPTLKTRGRDHLDFHEVSVESLKAALKAAFMAGVELGIGMGLDHTA